MVVAFIQCSRGILSVGTGACIFRVIGVRERVEGHEIYTVAVELHFKEA